MYKLVESRKVYDQWYIYRRYWIFWVLLDVRTGLSRAVDQLMQIRSRGARGNRELANG
jgi:hypothetical protein